MIKTKNKALDRYVPMQFSLTAEHIESLITLSEAHDLKYSKTIRIFIDYFKNRPNGLKKAIEEYDKNGKN